MFFFSYFQGVRKRYGAHVDSSKTLETFVQSEASEVGKREGTACLVRLIRYVSFHPCNLYRFADCVFPSRYSASAFIQHALQHMQDHPNEELHVCFRSAYDVVLKHHHAWVLQKVLYVRFIHLFKLLSSFLGQLRDGWNAGVYFTIAINFISLFTNFPFYPITIRLPSVLFLTDMTSMVPFLLVRLRTSLIPSLRSGCTHLERLLREWRDFSKVAVMARFNTSKWELKRCAIHTYTKL